MTTRVFLIRHGATLLSAEDRFAGETDVDLSETGRDQARRLAARLSSMPVKAVYASPMRRTLATAGILAEAHGLEPIPEPGLQEISHGHWEGMSRQEVETKFPEEYKTWEMDPFTFAPRGGESGLAVTARALPALLDIVTTNDDSQVIVVSHKATIRLLLSMLLGFDARRYRDRLDQSPAALNVIDFKDTTHTRLTLFNDTSHYASDSQIPPFPEKRLSKWWDRP